MTAVAALSGGTTTILGGAEPVFASLRPSRSEFFDVLARRRRPGGTFHPRKNGSRGERRP